MALNNLHYDLEVYISLVVVTTSTSTKTSSFFLRFMQTLQDWNWVLEFGF